MNKKKLTEDIKEQLRALAEVYVEEENPLATFGSWDNVLKLFKVMEWRTDEYSKGAYKNLPSRVKIYRGICTQDGDTFNNDLGISWTTNIKIAKMFALRFTELGGTAYILESEINKSDIIYFTNKRNESEVIIEPLYLADYTYEKLGKFEDLTLVKPMPKGNYNE